MSNQYPREMLLGRWYRSEQVGASETITEYANMAADGSYEFSFITHSSAGDIIEEITELGDWGLVGDIHFTLTKAELVDEQHYAADLANPDNYQAYQVLSLTSQVFEYQHVVTKEIFTLRRILTDVGYC